MVIRLHSPILLRHLWFSWLWQFSRSFRSSAPREKQRFRRGGCLDIVGAFPFSRYVKQNPIVRVADFKTVAIVPNATNAPKTSRKYTILYVLPPFLETSWHERFTREGRKGRKEEERDEINWTWNSTRRTNIAEKGGSGLSQKAKGKGQKGAVEPGILSSGYPNIPPIVERRRMKGQCNGPVDQRRQG